MEKVIVEKYNPDWQIEFNKAKSFYTDLLKDLEVDIVHVGSTSVKGLWAKPILDIDIIVNKRPIRDLVIKRLADAGYTHIGNLGVEGREAFKYAQNTPPIRWLKHNLYVCMMGSDNLQNHLLLKKHLSRNPDAVKKYSSLKRKLAEDYPHDIDSYVEGKTELITQFLKEEGMSTSSLNQIEEINKKNI